MRRGAALLVALLTLVGAGGCDPASDQSYGARLAACLRDAGWQTTMDAEGGGFSVDNLTAAHRPALELDTEACEQQLGPPPAP